MFFCCCCCCCCWYLVPVWTKHVLRHSCCFWYLVPVWTKACFETASSFKVFDFENPKALKPLKTSETTNMRQLWNSGNSLALCRFTTLAPVRTWSSCFLSEISSMSCATTPMSSVRRWTRMATCTTSSAPGISASCPPMVGTSCLTTVMSSNSQGRRNWLATDSTLQGSSSCMLTEVGQNFSDTRCDTALAWGLGLKLWKDNLAWIWL